MSHVRQSETPTKPSLFRHPRYVPGIFFDFVSPNEPYKNSGHTSQSQSFGLPPAVQQHRRTWRFRSVSWSYQLLPTNNNGWAAVPVTVSVLCGWEDVFCLVSSVKIKLRMIAHMCGAGVEKKRYLNTVLRVPDIILSRESIYVFFFSETGSLKHTTCTAGFPAETKGFRRSHVWRFPHG